MPDWNLLSQLFDREEQKLHADEKRGHMLVHVLFEHVVPDSLSEPVQEGLYQTLRRWVRREEKRREG